MTLPNRGTLQPTKRFVGDSDMTSASQASQRGARGASTQSGRGASTGVREFMAQQRARVKAQQDKEKLRASKRAPKAPMTFAGSSSYAWDDTLQRSEAFGQSPPPSHKLETVIKQAKQSGKLNISNRNLDDVPSVVWDMYHVDPDSITIDLSGGSDTWYDQEELTRMVAADNTINSISERIGEEFGALRHVDFHNNQLTSLPKSFATLHYVTFVNLSNNRFEELPAELYALGNLRELNLSANKIDTLALRISNWASLETLVMNDNVLSSLPQEMENLPSLRRLQLNGNQLSTLPTGFLSTFGHQLEEVEMANNKIQSITISGKLQLKRIDLHNNRLQTLSLDAETSLESLYELLLSRNRLDQLDHVSTVARNLTVLDISSNKFEDIPESVLQLEQLKRLDFSSNHLKNMPARLGSMPNLQVISWEGNPLQHPPRHMSGSLDVLKSLRDTLKSGDDQMLVDNIKLRDMKLSDSPITSPLVVKSSPRTEPSLGSAPPTPLPTSQPHQAVKNKTLDLSKQQLQELSAETTESIDSQVAHVKLDQNLLVEFPRSLEYFANSLVTLSLHRNKLTKFELTFRLTVLKELNLSNNQISSFSIREKDLAPLLTTLNLSCNRLVQVPSDLTELLPSLTVFHANTNKITTIEPQSYNGVRVLDLGNNDIAQVPPLLGRVTSIKELNLDGNCFRVPRRTTLVAGTESIMEFLRNRIVE